ncbi:MAG: FtsX-like permease family protein [Candidatus Lernaella stagnicola]|nr:FtsX-like permease family protein [Candidatus Lernaella stagnicola]
MLLSKMLWLTAWRNLWRNKRRTLILLAAIVVGLLGVIFYIALVNAWWGQSVENAVAILTGHVQVQAPGYHENPQLKRNIAIDPALRPKIMNIDHVAGAAARIKTMILVSNSEKSEMAQLIATEPGHEPQVSMIPNSIVEGRWLTSKDERKIVIGRTMAERFKTKLNRRMIVRATAPSGEVVDQVFRIVGIYDTGLKSFDKSAVYVRLNDAQTMFGMENRATEWVVATQLPDHAVEVAALVGGLVPPKETVVTTWMDLNPLVVKTMELSQFFMWFFNMFFYLAMAFGVANTMLMSVLERTKEIGMMLALGVKRSMILTVILLEALLLACVAGIVGGALGGGLVGWASERGLDLSAWVDGMSYAGMRGVLHPYVRVTDMILAIAVTAVVAVLMAIYPAWKASRMNPTTALRHV